MLAHADAARDPLGAAHPWYVLAEFADSGTHALLEERVEQALGECAGNDMLLDVALARSEAQANKLWKIRDTIPEAQFFNVKHDVSVPVSKVPDLIERAGSALEGAFPGCAVYAFGHIGDGNVHYNIGMPEPRANEALVARSAEVNALVYAVVSELGGSISAEHGLGQLKREEITRHKDALELELMRLLKRSLDPQGIMNPGKVL